MTAWSTHTKDRTQPIITESQAVHPIKAKQQICTLNQKFITLSALVEHKVEQTILKYQFILNGIRLKTLNSFNSIPRFIKAVEWTIKYPDNKLTTIDCLYILKVTHWDNSSIFFFFFLIKTTKYNVLYIPNCLHFQKKELFYSNHDMNSVVKAMCSNVGSQHMQQITKQFIDKEKDDRYLSKKILSRERKNIF